MKKMYIFWRVGIIIVIHNSLKHQMEENQFMQRNNVMAKMSEKPLLLCISDDPI